MNLRTYLFGLSVAERKTFAEKCDTSAAHLTNIAYGYKPPGPKLAVAIELHSNRTVKRQDLLPDDWKKIWPELQAA